LWEVLPQFRSDPSFFHCFSPPNLSSYCRPALDFSPELGSLAYSRFLLSAMSFHTPWLRALVSEHLIPCHLSGTSVFVLHYNRLCDPPVVPYVLIVTVGCPLQNFGHIFSLPPSSPPCMAPPQTLDPFFLWLGSGPACLSRFCSLVKIHPLP